MVTARYRCRARERGVAYLWVLLAVALLGAGAGIVGEVWHTAARRDQEAELLFIGDAYRRAIGRYYDSSPGEKRYPTRLEQLVADDRLPRVRHHLRRPYADPLTGKAEWGLVRAGEAIIGVYSLAPGTPLKTGGFGRRDAAFADSTAYANWQFVHLPGGTDGERPPPANAGELPPEERSPPPVPPDPPAPPADAPPPRNTARENFCALLRRNDAASCNLLRLRADAVAAASCEASAQAREAACQGGGSLPPLIYPSTLN